MLGAAEPGAAEPGASEPGAAAAAAHLCCSSAEVWRLLDSRPCKVMFLHFYLFQQQVILDPRRGLRSAAELTTARDTRIHQQTTCLPPAHPQPSPRHNLIIKIRLRRAHTYNCRALLPFLRSETISQKQNFIFGLKPHFLCFTV